MTKLLNLKLDRSAATPLADQIQQGIAKAIRKGVLEPGGRLPSWQDLAAQLGVARGTVRKAYEKLDASQLIVASRSAGTRVAPHARAEVKSEHKPDPGSLVETYQEMTRGPALFQMGIPAMETFPATLVARIRIKAIRAETSANPLYPDPRGELAFRREIARYLAVARGIDCSASQVIVTSGFNAGLGLALRTLGVEGQLAWIEDPCFPLTRRGLELARASVAPIPVDADGLNVAHGIRHAPSAKLAVVTPGQQAPLGATMSLERRIQLLEWAAAKQAWIIEDDYLSELQLAGRAAPALASLDHAGRVIHIGSFSKTISPTLRLGFIVTPPALAGRFAEVALCLAPAPGPSLQLATAEFMREGHYLRHLRRLKRAYSAKRDALLAQLRPRFDHRDILTAGLAVLVTLPLSKSDIDIVEALRTLGMSPSPLSTWYASKVTARSGLLLSVATSPTKEPARVVSRLAQTIQRFG